MKVTREQRAEHRRRIVEAAAGQFREHGPDGVNVAEIMRMAGLTHGGFYGHFDSKEALFAAALAAALSEAAAQLEDGGPNGFAAYARGYASRQHVENRRGGCPMAALGVDVARASGEVKTAFADGVRRFLDAAATAAGHRADGLARFSQLLGALVLARGLNGCDDALADELLALASSAAAGDAGKIPS